MLAPPLDCRIAVDGEQDLVAGGEGEARQHRVAARCCVLDENIVVPGPAETGSKALGRLAQQARQACEEIARMSLHAAAPGVLLRQDRARRCAERAVVEEREARIEEPCGAVAAGLRCRVIHALRARSRGEKTSP